MERLEDRVLLTVDLAVTKTAAPAIASVGVPETYTIIVANNGTTPTTGTTFITDNLPANGDFQSDSASAGITITASPAVNAPGGAVQATIATGFAAGTSETLSITITPTAPGVLTNTAAAVDVLDASTSSDTISTPVNGTATGTAAADLSIVKTGTPATLGVGGTETYTLVVSDLSTVNAATVAVTDLLPAGATSPTIAGGPVGTTFTTGVGVVTATIPTLTSATPATLTVTATLNAPGLAINTANVEGLPGDTNQLNNNSTATTTVTGTATGTAAADLSIVKSGTPATLGAGGTETYTLVVSDLSTTTATAVLVTDLLPAGASNATISGGPVGTTFTTAPGVATATIATIASGTPATLTVTATLNTPGLNINTANVEGLPGDTDQTNNTSTATTTVTGTATGTAAVDLSIVKTGTPATLGVGGTETYTLVVTDTNTATAATAVTVTDLLPAGATNVSISGGPAGATFTTAAGVATASIATVASGTPATLTVTATLNTPGLNINTANVEGLPGDTNQLNNTSTATTTVTGTATGTAAADLSIVKTGTPATVGVGGTETYTLVVTDLNTATAATAVTVTDLLPAGATNVAISGGPVGTTFTTAAGVATASIATVASGTPATLTVTATLNTPGVNINTANVEGLPGDTNQLNNTSTATTLVTGTATGTAAVDLSIVKTGTPATLGVGGIETYTLVVTDTNTATAATAVTVTDLLPAGATNVTFSGGPAGTAFTTAPGVATATIATVASGTPATLTLTATLNTLGVNINTANVEGLPGDTNQLNNTSTATTTVTGTATGTAAADLSIVKTGTPATLGVGGTETYTLVVTDLTTATAATAVTVTDLLPAGATNVTISGGPAGTTFTTAAGVATATIATVPSGTPATLTVTATLNNAGIAINTANVEGLPGDTNQLNNNSTATTLVTGTATGTAAADLAIVKTGTPTTLAAGSTETYTLVVSNSATATAATNVTVTDVLPAGATGATISGGPAGTTFSTGPGAETATISSLAAGASTTLTVTATLNTLGPAINVANVEGLPGDTDQGNNFSTATATVTAVVDLGVVKTESASTLSPGGTETYTIVVTNHSTVSPGTNVTVTDSLPAGATFVSDSSTAAGVTFNNSQASNATNPTVTASVGTLAANTSETLTIVVTAPTANTTATLVNTASVTGNETDNVSGNNSSSVTATVTATTTSTPQLTITKAGPATDAAGGVITYTITVSNVGNASATGATITDTLPAGLTNIMATDNLGAVVSVNSNTNTVSDALDPLAAMTGVEVLTITATPSASLNGTSISNQASVTLGTTTTTSNTVTTAIGTVQPPPGHICYLAGVPGDGTATTFVTNLYRELLGREPDAPSLPLWVNYVQQHGVAGQVQVIRDFMNSAEYKAHYVTCVYEAFLNRAPDAGGLQFWTQKMGNPGTPTQNTGSADEKFVLAAIVGSQEFFVDSGNTQQGFVNALYHDLLGRAPDAGGLAFWALDAQIRGPSDRDGLVRDFLTTPEATHLILDSFYPAAGGTASNPLPAPGTPAGEGGTPLEEVLGGGWENLYYEGPFSIFPEAVDPIAVALAAEGVFAELVGGAPWDDVQLLMLATPQYYTNGNHPVTTAVLS